MTGLAVLATAAPAAGAVDPILPLTEVRPGMSCTGLSVIRGTEISSFDVEVLDVIAAEAGLSGPRILVRASGAAVAPGGVGQGFSGSPILCDGRNAGAISETLGEYGNQVVLATPIEEILTDRPAAAARARRDARLARAARPLTAPLTVSGLSTRMRLLLTRAARQGGRTVIAAPAAPAAGYGPVDLRPGASVAAALSTGNVALGAVGTVAYRDGPRLWAFGHGLDGMGRRSLFLQDSYVFGVIANPLGLPHQGAITYKLASTAGHVQGAITSDTFASVAGTVGTEPPAVSLRVRARGRDGRAVVLRSRLADERRLGGGAGLSLVTPLAAGQALDRLMRSFRPVTFSMCARFRVRELRRPIGFCNPYFAVDGALADLGQAGGLLDSFDLAPLRVQRADVRLSAHPGVVEDVLVGTRAPNRVRRGRRIRVRVAVRRRGGGRRTISVPVRVPASIRPGERTLVMRGNSADSQRGAELFLILVEELTDEGPTGKGDAEPRTVRQLARAVRALHRPLGIQAHFEGKKPRIALRSDEVSYGGSVRVKLRVDRGPQRAGRRSGSRRRRAASGPRRGSGASSATGSRSGGSARASR